MKDMEILNRASAFLVKARCPQFSKNHKYHVVTSSHVISPWKWPKYYPDEWIQHINEKHTHYTVELRHDDGVFVSQFELLPKSFHHLSKDLAVLHLENEDNVAHIINEFGKFSHEILPVELESVSSKDNLEFHGHEVINVNGSPNFDNEDNRIPIPKIVDGSLSFLTKQQIFAKTNSILNDGMCGGPVTVNRIINSIKKPFICGVIDGIVPTSHDQVQLRGHASFIGKDDIHKFIDSVEDGSIQPLMGGEASRYVASDQDPEKLDLENVLKKFT